MELIYRGTTFNYDPAERAASLLAQRTSDSPYELTCRGRTYRIDPTVIMETSGKPVVYDLNYRGTTYQVQRNEQGRVTAIASSAHSSQHRTLQDANQTKNRSFVCEENNTPIQL
jgi:YD repeat-containing protein